METRINTAIATYSFNGVNFLETALTYIGVEPKRRNMNCNFNANAGCSRCCNFVKTTSIVQTGTVLTLTIPNMSLCNGKTVCVNISQALPLTISDTTTVAIKVGTASHTVITPCQGNLLYANQLRVCKTYSFKFASDTLMFMYRGGWRLYPTSHQFNCIPMSFGAIPATKNKVGDVKPLKIENAKEEVK